MSAPPAVPAPTPRAGPTPLEWPESLREAVAATFRHYPNRRSAALPLLWLAQREWGWLSPEALRLVARTTELPETEVFGVATFYTMFNLQRVGKYQLQVCMTLSCSLMGADRIFRHLSEKLGIGNGETTPDGRFTLRRVECLAACGGGPCLQVNERKFHENLDEAAVDRLLESLP
jgi:NADH-quinone oxidoreductase subunit E